MANQNESIAPTSKERKIAAFKENHRGRISRGTRDRVISEPILPREDEKVSEHNALDHKVVHDVPEEQHETKGRRNVKRENNSRYGRREHHGHLKS